MIFFISKNRIKGSTSATPTSTLSQDLVKTFRSQNVLEKRPNEKNLRHKSNEWLPVLCYVIRWLASKVNPCNQQTIESSFSRQHLLKSKCKHKFKAIHH